MASIREWGLLLENVENMFAQVIYMVVGLGTVFLESNHFHHLTVEQVSLGVVTRAPSCPPNPNYFAAISEA